jgi:hypothetical protein
MSGGGGYPPPPFRFSETQDDTMRAEIESLLETAKQSIGLLRRHL